MMNGNAHKIGNRVRAACVLVAALSGLLALGRPALATFPGDNGVIAFASNGDPFDTNRERDFEIFTMTPQGRLLKQLTFNDLTDHEPDWSPDERGSCSGVTGTECRRST